MALFQKLGRYSEYVLTQKVEKFDNPFEQNLKLETIFHDLIVDFTNSNKQCIQDF